MDFETNHLVKNCLFGYYIYFWSISILQNGFPGQTMVVFTNYHWIKLIFFNVTVLYYPFSDLVGFTLESFTKLFAVEWCCLIFFPIWIFCMPYAFIKTIKNFPRPNRSFFLFYLKSIGICIIMWDVRIWPFCLFVFVRDKQNNKHIGNTISHDT